MMGTLPGVDRLTRIAGAQQHQQQQHQQRYEGREVYGEQHEGQQGCLLGRSGPGVGVCIRGQHTAGTGTTTTAATAGNSGGASTGQREGGVVGSSKTNNKNDKDKTDEMNKGLEGRLEGRRG